MPSPSNDQPAQSAPDHPLEIENPPENPREHDDRPRHCFGPHASSRVYPYTALPQAPRRARTRSCPSIKVSKDCILSHTFCCLWCSIFFGVLLFWIISFVLNLLYDPSNPVFQVDSIAINSFNDSNYKLSSTWDGKFTVQNYRNRLGIDFQRVEVYVFGEEKFMSVVVVEPFHLGARKEHAFPVHFVTGSMGSFITDRNQSSLEISSDVRMTVWATYGPGSSWETVLRMDVFCADMKIQIATATNSGNVNTGGSRPCSISCKLYTAADDDLNEPFAWPKHAARAESEAA